jgi:hypothetical protein
MKDIIKIILISSVISIGTYFLGNNFNKNYVYSRDTVDYVTESNYKTLYNQKEAEKVKEIEGDYYVAKWGDDSNDGLTWENAFLTITNAVNAAGDADDITIYVNDGTYTNTPIDLRHSGVISLKSVNGAKNTIIKGNKTGPIVIGAFHTAGTYGHGQELHGFTIRGGKATFYTYANNNGGGVIAMNTYDCEITDCVGNSTRNGHGVALTGGKHYRLKVYGNAATFTDLINSANMYLYPYNTGQRNTCNLLIEDSEIYNNTGIRYVIGAQWNIKPTIRRTKIYNNKNGEKNASVVSQVNIYDSEITSNRSGCSSFSGTCYGFGYIIKDSTAVNCRIINNKVHSYPFNDSVERIVYNSTVTDCYFSGNENLSYLEDPYVQGVVISGDNSSDGDVTVGFNDRFKVGETFFTFDGTNWITEINGTNYIFDLTVKE